MINPVELAEATAELNADYAGTPEATRWVVTCNGYRRRFHTNACGRFASACSDAEATRFDSIHEAGAACRAARLTGIITIDPVNIHHGATENTEAA